MELDLNELKGKSPKAPVMEAPKKVLKKTKHEMRNPEEVGETVNCLQNRRIIVRHIPKESGTIKNPKHVLYGGMAESAIKYFSVPMLSSGVYVNILTDNEKECLEEVMGLEYNALSIYRKVDNYWDNKMVRLGKADNYLDLRDPEQYISYKILLANKDYIAPSLDDLENKPKATYMFVIVDENDEAKHARKEMSSTMESYLEFGKIQDKSNVLRTIIEAIEGRPVSSDTKIEALQSKVNRLIQSNPKIFLKVVKDELLNTKVLIKDCIEHGVISNRGGFLYLKSDGSPLCENGEDPTLSIAAKYISNPKHQELKFSLEDKIK